ncbi:hypothetical protein J6590_063862 [Homalodisca vitripennis]|nr:hypothetical protein J6590_063862 [Homalodisca vitripennis]
MLKDTKKATKLSRFRDHENQHTTIVDWKTQSTQIKVEVNLNCPRPFPSSTEGAGHLVPKSVEVHSHCSSHFLVLPRTLVTWYQNSSKYIYTARPTSKFYRGRWTLGMKIRRIKLHCVRPICEFHRGRWSLGTKIRRIKLHCVCPICEFHRGRWSLGTKIRRSTSTLCSPSHFQVLPRALVTWYENSSNKTTLCSSHLRVPPRALVTWYQNPSKYITLLVPFSSSTEDAGHLVPKFVEVHPLVPLQVLPRALVTWYENSSNKTTLCSSHLRVPPRALVTWYQNSSVHPHCARPISSSTEGAGHLV